MPIDTPTYKEIVERVKSDIANELPDVDPTIYGSFVRALAVSLARSEEHTSELQSHRDLVCRLLLEKKKNTKTRLSKPEKSTMVVM